jgi:hypothetical protein
LKCAETIRSGITYQFVMVRDEKGKLGLFLNGYPCDSGMDLWQFINLPK